MPPIVLPPPTQRDHPQSDARPILAGLLWMMHTGAAWREIPADHGPWHTLYSRCQLWRRTGVWGKISAVIRDDADPRA